MITIAKPYLDEAEIEAVTAVLRSGVIAEGPRVAQFEQAFAEYIGVDHAVAVNSGTAALHVALMAHGIGKGDEVITSPFSFVATANSIVYTGAKPVFADIEPDTYIISADQVHEMITSRTKAIMPVHLYGHAADMDAIMEIAEDHNLLVIEDACQAHGATYKGKKVGSFGTGTFSFYPTKNMTTSEGGIITTDDPDIAARSRMLRAHGSKQRYLHEMIGYNFRMTDISAAIGIVQMGRLDEFTEKRRKNASKLSMGLKGTKNIILPVEKENCLHVYHQYTVRTDHRDSLRDALQQKDIGTGTYYPLCIHQQPLYKEMGYTGSYPNSEKAASEVLSVPVHPALSDVDINTVIASIKEWAQR
ncbi:putative PLP-dependent enzyme possibly involved in cell wall biogenesis [Methanomethylovorans hollandica DSM 15978]|uniref:Putative PLP-dependent enzyme possibly involved in cell wall biogenesis n=1 Tax=Methanomethylovorans hollandica (strain DSM 15978 / NBRC 107637 / DMS1) TaxID=867904 RepID=L0KX15_METHD|nr:DegT/DnrJ/EryC1/StrS family aminotransferase [Methanomethylovorans hollandica]AGB49982.1 putative PLP-dependent enzyme possibly involved in cell wall biogenesis [Methanomethylovorans hollandica DSM 15978]